MATNAIGEVAAGTLSATGQSDIVGPCRGVTVSLSGTWAGTANLQRKVGADWFTFATFTGNVQTTVQVGARGNQIRLDWTKTSGSLVYVLEGDSSGGAGRVPAQAGDEATTIAGVGIVATASFTPAAAAYSAADIIGASTEFAFTYAASGLAVPVGSLIRILTAITRIDVTAVPAGQTSYTLYGYSATQPSAQADNDAWTLASGDLASFRGSIPLGTPVDLGGALYVKSSNIDLDVRLVTSSLWGRLVTDGAFTATAVARQITLYGLLI